MTAMNDKMCVTIKAHGATWVNMKWHQYSMVEMTKKIEQRETRIKKAEDIIASLARNGVNLSVHTEAKEYLKELMEGK